MTEGPPGTVSGAIACGLLCSLAAALPASARVLANSAGTSRMLLTATLWAAVSLLVVPVGYWLRRARLGGFPAADRALLAGTALSALPLALFGGMLKSTTHHRPLGGATFAVAALCALALCIGLSFRFLQGSSRGALKSPWQNLFTLGCAASLGFVLVLGSVPATRPSLLDFLALTVAAVVAGVVELPNWLARLRWPVVVLGWVTLLACAALALRSSPLVRSLTTQAPVSFAALSWLGGGS